MNAVLNFITQTLAGELIVVITGVLITQLMHLTWDRWRYGNWAVHIRRGDKKILTENIPASKAKEILSDRIALRIYLKGLVSAYTWLRCDLLTEGKQTGLFTEDHRQRLFIIDVDKNPQPEDRKPPNEAP